MTPELKPCPFCGGEVVIEMDESWYWEWEVYCPKCGASNLNHFDRKSEAIEFWNRRTNENGNIEETQPSTI